MSRTVGYLAGDGQRLSVIDNDGQLLVEGDGLDVLVQLRHTPIDLLSADDAAVVAIMSAVYATDRPESVAVRGHDGLTMRVHGLRWTGGLAIIDGTAIFPTADAGDSLTQWAAMVGQVLPPPRSATRRCQVWRELHRDQLARLERLAGLPPSRSLASTAMRAALPVTWRRGATRMLRSDEWRWLRQSYYGGRIELYQPGWTGQAVEYDLRSAYGWALSQPVPDWKLYVTRRPLVRQPAWYAVTVELPAVGVGVLPVRDPANEARLTYPSGQVVRGCWTREDLDRAEGNGARVLEVHAAMSGRWSDELRPTVAGWLEARERTVDRAERATLRALCVSLAGRLAIRSDGWALWHASEGPPPAGARMLHADSGWLVYPQRPARLPVSLPTTASYITARVRSLVWPWIADGRAILTNTDSVHLPAGEPGPPLGDAAGEWSIKAAGDACYRSIRNYRVGDKQILAPDVAAAMIRSAARKTAAGGQHNGL